MTNDLYWYMVCRFVYMYYVWDSGRVDKNDYVGCCLRFIIYWFASGWYTGNRVCGIPFIGLRLRDIPLIGFTVYHLSFYEWAIYR
ncbi:hypothetical protein [Bacillus sp. 1P02SD]|uniref:hypothetical protein n=1 Tax=Bacillus sp. 1P02SD TaxID=3132264 RepID=UPI00399F03CC